MSGSVVDGHSAHGARQPVFAEQFLKGRPAPLVRPRQGVGARKAQHVEREVRQLLRGGLDG
ncbi:hypothetical protein QF026_000024 [Streptomyces aurantiacus]|uniref:hypothetical protein n=1 Tax=Streptomyces aurantiacus TaxID=47760 RepID=UPI002794C241|nr:hypothetical protein [Streptomyces aurantiacus]MDQ0771558.1 hypothetical protein [Streptomyces aurantiacus]